MRKNHALLIASILLASAGSALAQAPPSPATPAQQTAPPPDRSTCAAMEKGAHPGAVAPEGQTTGQAREPLGDKLAKSDGVLCPPAGVDPEMHAPAPDAGKTPVIPPPGSPGGDPSVRPK
jgi:hypothetical protein